MMRKNHRRAPDDGVVAVPGESRRLDVARNAPPCSGRPTGIFRALRHRAGLPDTVRFMICARRWRPYGPGQPVTVVSEQLGPNESIELQIYGHLLPYM
jgi:hypothetical protein